MEEKMQSKGQTLSRSIHKDDLVGKYVEYFDRDGKSRINKVVRVDGNYLTVVDNLGKKSRVYKDKVLHQIHHGHCKTEIMWNRRKTIQAVI
jgi:hypothetical protein